MDRRLALRLVDANVNRAREGLRVLEDTTRFLSRKPQAYKGFRILRHKLDSATRGLYPELVRARDSQNDVGKSSSQKLYADVSEIVAANFKRCQEALRVLEEYSRLFSQDTSGRFKEIRFQLYVLEKNFLRVTSHESRATKI